MKKILISILAAIMAFGLSACSSGVSQEEYDNLLAEHSKLQEQYDNLRTGYLDIMKEKSAETVSETEIVPFKVIAETINENATANISSDGFVEIVIPMGDKSVSDIKNDLELYGTLIPSKLKEANLKSCFILIVNSENLVHFGYSFTAEEEVSAFISDKMV